MQKIKKIFSFAINLKKRTDKDAVYAVAGHSTLFVIISFFPLLMLLLSIVKYLPLSEEWVVETIKNVPLGAMNDPINDAVSEIYSRSGSFVLSVTAVGLLWSGSTSVYSVILGLNKVYDNEETRNYFVVRGLSLLYTLAFLSAITIALVLMVFGENILEMLKISSLFPNVMRLTGSFVLLFLMFDFLYTAVPNRKSKMIFELPGAVLSAAGWIVFSYIYSLYIRNFSDFSYVYGSLAAVVFLMMWLYFCMYIFFIGAEINQMAAEMGWCKNRREKFLNRKKSEKGKCKVSKQYFLIDLDGTLVNSEQGIKNCIKYALNELKYPVPSEEILNNFIGPSLMYSFTTYCNMKEDTAANAVALYRERYTAKGVYENTLYEGIESTLKTLKENGKTVILATAKPEPFARTILEYLKLERYFDCIVGATFDGTIGTKDDVIKEVFRRCEIADKSKAVMVGDRDYDVLGAKENGMECIGVTYGFAQKDELRNAGADYIVNSFAEILKFQ